MKSNRLIIHQSELKVNRKHLFDEKVFSKNVKQLAKLVQYLFALLPIRHQTAHNTVKFRRVIRVDIMRKLVNNNAFNTLDRSTNQKFIQADRVIKRATASPTGYHTTILKIWHRQSVFRKKRKHKKQSRANIQQTKYKVMKLIFQFAILLLTCEHQRRLRRLR